jgi:hypothetical protein
MARSILVRPTWLIGVRFRSPAGCRGTGPFERVLSDPGA